jgi:hypothetical protein
MNAKPAALLLVLSQACALAALRQEHFDKPSENWEGINNRNTNFAPRTIRQDFGYASVARLPAGPRGAIGGLINPAGEAAYYGYRLAQPIRLDQPITAAGKLLVKPGPGHFLLGFFNADTLNEWRTPNTLVIRINGRGEGFHCHLEYCTSRWRSGAGVIGEIVPGERINAKLMPSDQAYDWRLAYDPSGGEGHGLVTLTLGEFTGSCRLSRQERADGASFTHFGLLPVLKAWDDPGEAWLSEVSVNGQRFDLSTDPNWEGVNNRRVYETKNIRPRFDFGWSPTQFAGGKGAGELGGLIFRGDCREPHRMGAYGDRLSPLSLKNKLYARGRLSVLRAVSDSTASIGFYHSKTSLGPNPAQNQSIPLDYLGINIEGPSSEGFFFYPVYRVHGDNSKAYDRGMGPMLQIYPDRQAHDWELVYDPDGANGRGLIKVTLDGQSCTLELAAEDKKVGATFDRFGICTPWIDGNSVTAYFDDLEYTAEP